VEVIRDVVNKSVLWSNQANESLATFSDQQLYLQTVSLLMNKLKDRHSRYTLVKHFPGRTLAFFSLLREQMGDAYDFSFFNPSGHYCLNMAKAH